MKILNKKEYEKLIANQKNLLGYKLKLGVENRFGALLNVLEFESFDDLFQEVFEIKHKYMRFDYDDLSQANLIVQCWKNEKLIMQFTLHDGSEI